MSKGILSPDGLWMWTGTEWIPAPPTSPPPSVPAPSSNTQSRGEQRNYYSSNSKVEVGNYFDRTEDAESQFHQIIQEVGENSHMEAIDVKTGQPVDGKYAKWSVESVKFEDRLYWVVANKKQTLVQNYDIEKVRFIFSRPNKDSLIEGHTWENGVWSPHFTTGKVSGMIFNPDVQTQTSTQPKTGQVDRDFERQIRRNIQRIGLDNFPDDENATWNIVGIKFENGLHWVETIPIPHVGYEKIMFGMENPTTGGLRVCQCWDNGKWTELFSVG